jgi:hypothetical protein
VKKEDVVTTKVYDPEETRGDTAKRLIGKAIEKRGEESQKLFGKLVGHARRLNRSDRMAAIEHLRREQDLLIGLLQQTGEDLPEFVWPSDSVDQEWSL